MNEKELLKLKKKIDSAEYEEQQLKGENKAILANLKEDFDCETIEEAKEKRKKIRKEIDNLSEQIQTNLEEISKKYEIEDED